MEVSNSNTSIKEEITQKKEKGDNMATLTKPINKIAVIANKDSKNFIQDFNKNKVGEEFLNSCKKAGKLFGKRKQ